MNYRRTFADLSWVFATMPVILAVTVYSHSLHLRWSLGHSPYLRELPPSPLNRMLLDIHYLGLVVPAWLLTLGSIVLWSTFAVAGKSELRGGQFVWQTAFWLVSMFALFIGSWMLIGTSYGYWLID